MPPINRCKEDAICERAEAADARSEAEEVTDRCVRDRAIPARKSLPRPREGDLANFDF